MRLFFLTIPKPLRQHPIYKKIIHSALRGVGSTSRPVNPTGWKRSRRLIFKDLGEKLPDPSSICKYTSNNILKPNT
jgi:hypothetical protein